MRYVGSIIGVALLVIVVAATTSWTVVIYNLSPTQINFVVQSEKGEPVSDAVLRFMDVRTNKPGQVPIERGGEVIEVHELAVSDGRVTIMTPGWKTQEERIVGLFGSVTVNSSGFYKIVIEAPDHESKALDLETLINQASIISEGSDCGVVTETITLEPID